ncbi:MAG: hypothetical protein ABI181_13665 [Mycobacteriaceae bacterium]
MTVLAEWFARAAGVLLAEHPEDGSGRMLSSPGLRTGGRFYAFCPGDDVIVKLPQGRVQQLVADGGGTPCSPRAGRPMREWVQLRPSDQQTLAAYLGEARAFVAG